MFLPVLRHSSLMLNSRQIREIMASIEMFLPLSYVAIVFLFAHFMLSFPFKYKYQSICDSNFKLNTVLKKYIPAIRPVKELNSF